MTGGEVQTILTASYRHTAKQLSIRPRTYLFNIGAQRFFAQNVKTLLDTSQGLGGVDIGTGRNPDSLQARVIQHLIVRVVDLDAGILILLASPDLLRFFSAADRDYFRARDSFDKCQHMAFSLSMSMSMSMSTRLDML